MKEEEEISYSGGEEDFSGSWRGQRRPRALLNVNNMYVWKEDFLEFILLTVVASFVILRFSFVPDEGIIKDLAPSHPSLQRTGGKKLLPLGKVVHSTLGSLHVWGAQD